MKFNKVYYFINIANVISNGIDGEQRMRRIRRAGAKKERTAEAGREGGSCEGYHT